MTNSNWKPVPHDNFRCDTGKLCLSKEPCTCHGTRWHGYGERVGDFAAVWALTGWLAGLKPDVDGCVECYDCGGEGQYFDGHPCDPEATQCERCEGTGRIRIAAPVQPAAVAVPDGWVLVPKEPTQRMLEVMHLRYWRGTATGETVSAHWKDCSAPLWKETYREMLAAAQAKGEKP